jgi:hypothetical protein
MFNQLKTETRNFSFIMKPFPLDSLNTLRRYILWHYPGIALKEVHQTKGMRGGVKKEWKLVVDDTESFRALVAHGWPQADGHSYGSARAFTNTSMNAWVPPLTVNLTASDVRGERNTQCKWKMAAGRVTEHGFSFSPGFDHASGNLAMAKKYMAVHVAQLQTWRLQAMGGGNGAQVPTNGAQAPTPLPPLPHAMLLLVAPHLR